LSYGRARYWGVEVDTTTAISTATLCGILQVGSDTDTIKTVIRYDGTMGLGTTSPIETLDVDGDGRFRTHTHLRCELDGDQTASTQTITDI